jgi:hypothetical protein
MLCRLGDHNEINKELSELNFKEGIDIQLAYDGLFLNNFARVCMSSTFL